MQDSLKSLGHELISQASCRTFSVTSCSDCVSCADARMITAGQRKQEACRTLTHERATRLSELLDVASPCAFRFTVDTLTGADAFRLGLHVQQPSQLNDLDRVTFHLAEVRRSACCSEPHNILQASYINVLFKLGSDYERE